MGDGEGPTTPECASTAVGNFTLRAVYKNPPSDGPASVTLKVIVVELVRSLTWTLLSACPNCCSEWPTFSMFNSVVSPKSIVDPVLSMTNIATRDGESLTFVASSPPFPGSQSFFPPDPSSPSLLAFDGKQDAFSLCKNNTANGRLDVVFSPVTGHPHYLLSDCSSISIQVVV
ncbi:hypothetical protein AX16_009046 [Volvariella volvacea WC 439]|nr:hypothetical protein AX16_009046 [Volvariella volvacea WC 439]